MGSWVPVRHDRPKVTLERCPRLESPDDGGLRREFVIIDLWFSYIVLIKCVR